MAGSAEPESFASRSEHAEQIPADPNGSGAELFESDLVADPPKRPASARRFDQATFSRRLADFASCTSTQEFEREQTIVVFDWDDCLCPSFWIKANRPALHVFSPCPDDPTYQAPLQEVAELVTQILTAAAEVGHVVVMTTQQVQWVEMTAKNFLPGVFPLFDKLQCSICYARGRYEVDAARNGHDAPARRPSRDDAGDSDLPTRPFRGELAKFYSRYSAQGWKNVVSVGQEERLVTSAPASKTKLCRVKTVKFLSEPSIEDLTAQLHVVHQWLQGIVRYDGVLDVDFEEDDELISEIHATMIG